MNRVEALWERQFDPAEDFPETPVRTRYMLCTSPRCGSHFLGHLLRDAGGFGYPLEYFNVGNLERWHARARAAGERNVLTFIQRVRTDRNGVFGVKVHYSQLPAFLAHEPAILDYRFILLERRDLVGQAVSYAWAAQTGSWISGMPERGRPRYDHDLIARKLSDIAAANAGWRAFLRGLGLRPLELTYEAVREDPEDAVGRIAEALGIAPAAGPVGGFRPESQKNPEKRAWADRFVEESRRRLAEGGAAAGPAAAGDRPAAPWPRRVARWLGTG